MINKKNFIAIVCMLVLVGFQQSFSQSVKIVSEEDYISRCLFNFSRYIEWPEENSKGSFVIGVVGDEKLYETMKESFQGKTTGMQKVDVIYFKKVSDITGYNHILFVAEWQSNAMTKTMKDKSFVSSLLVTEKEGMTENGAAINFLPHEGLMHFEICKKNVIDSGLKISSRLEQLALRTI